MGIKSHLNMYVTIMALDKKITNQVAFIYYYFKKIFYSLFISQKCIC